MPANRFAGAFIASTMALAAAPGAAREPWPVDNKLLGEPTDGSGAKKSRDVSGIACAEASGFPRVCVIADDEAQGVQIVRLEEDRIVAGTAIRLIHDLHDGEPVELDAEGVAYADGVFYVVGSHGRPRHETGKRKDAAKAAAKAAASRHLFRLRFDPAAVDADASLTGGVEIRDSAVLARLLKTQPEIGPAFDIPLEDGGLTVEGVAVAGARLYAGLRGPLLKDGRAAVLSAPLGVLFEGEAGAGELHRLDLGKDRRGRGRGVRDLVAYGSGFLVLAGPVLDPESDAVEDGDYAVHAWDGRGATRPLGDLTSHGEAVKPEALLPLSVEGDRLRLLVLFDGPKEGAPRTVLVRQP